MTVVDNLLQCDPKDFGHLSRKRLLIFFYEQVNLTARNNSFTPFDINNGNYVQPSYPNFVPPAQSIAQPHNNQQSKSGFQDYGF